MGRLSEYETYYMDDKLACVTSEAPVKEARDPSPEEARLIALGRKVETLLASEEGPHELAERFAWFWFREQFLESSGSLKTGGATGEGRISDSHIRAWADRHGLYLSSASDLRAAFEDARSLREEEDDGR
jgi:hypothetical protein